MARATEASVRGRFDGARFSHDGTSARMYREAEHFFVELTEGNRPTQRHEVGFTFGVTPLQQYLVAAEGGRLQALRVAWDTRPAEVGGQRWFHLLSNEKIGSGDPLHWAGPEFTWNHQCADCHATNVRRGWDDQVGAYATEYDELGVGCEACHGPGSLHVSGAGTGKLVPMPREIVSAPRIWQFEEGARIATLASDRAPADATQACAACHARRGDLGPSASDETFEDRYRLALLEDGLYFPDGQIREEVFVYGSFLLSKMHGAGVVCADCHDPHRGDLRRRGNDLCNTCHRAEAFDHKAHHLHPAGTPGSACVDCHMPERLYMEVDGRRDHRFGVPQPELTQTVGVPNQCDGCHPGRGTECAVAALAARTSSWKAPTWPARLVAARSMQRGGFEGLAVIFGDETVPPVVRATAVAELSAYPWPQTVEILAREVGHISPLVRRAVAEAALGLPPDRRIAIVERLLRDDVRSVRVAAGRATLEVDPTDLPAALRAARGQALGEYEAARTYDSDRAAGLVDLAHVAGMRGKVETARSLLERAIDREPAFTAAYVNLADLHRAGDDDAQAEAVLRAGLGKVADPAAVEHALGLTLVRRKRMDDALALLARAYEHQPENAQYGYVYAVALSEGDLGQAIKVLEGLLASRTGDLQLLGALADYLERAGRGAQARKLLREVQ